MIAANSEEPIRRMDGREEFSQEIMDALII
jgi:hypothetical protein